MTIMRAYCRLKKISVWTVGKQEIPSSMSYAGIQWISFKFYKIAWYDYAICKQVFCDLKAEYFFKIWG